MDCFQKQILVRESAIETPFALLTTAAASIWEISLNLKVQGREWGRAKLDEFFWTFRWTHEWKRY